MDMVWRRSAARDPTTPAKILEDLFEYEDCRIWLSKNPSSPERLMKKLGTKDAFSYCDSMNWRLAVANVLSHKNTSRSTILNILKWTDGFLNVRRPDDYHPGEIIRFDTYFEPSAASNSNTPVEYLAKFEKTGDENTLFWLLGNPNLPKPLIQKYVEIALPLFEHEQLHKYSQIANNRSLTWDQIEKLSQHPKFYIRESIARNLSTPISILIKLINDPESQVQYGAIFNPYLPLDVLKKRLDLTNLEIIKLGEPNPSRYKEAVNLAISRHPDITTRALEEWLSKRHEK